MTRDNAMSDYGLVIDEKSLVYAAEKALGGFNGDIWDILDWLESKFRLCYTSGFTGEAPLIGNDGSDNWGDVEHYKNDYIFWIPLKHYPTLFACAYSDFDELVAEFECNDIIQYLPEDFNIFDHIRHIIGTYYG